MIIRAKEGTALEEKLRELYESVSNERARAFARAAEIFGAEPRSLTYCWVFGFSYIYMISHPLTFESELENPPIYAKDLGNKTYCLSRRYKVAREIIKAFEDDFHGIKPELGDFGINTISNSRYCDWEVLQEKTGRFIFSASEWSFSGSSRDQYEEIANSDAIL
ncbi:hypothetical protein [Porphyromonas loveana]|uniref:hypothetical protein n=1 Tax=Porphyromonas loveana TaxID=1884669 RepID=UPI00359F8636